MKWTIRIASLLTIGLLFFSRSHSAEIVKAFDNLQYPITKEQVLDYDKELKKLISNPAILDSVRPAVLVQYIIKFHGWPTKRLLAEDEWIALRKTEVTAMSVILNSLANRRDPKIDISNLVPSSYPSYEWQANSKDINNAEKKKEYLEKLAIKIKEDDLVREQLSIDHSLKLGLNVSKGYLNKIYLNDQDKILDALKRSNLYPFLIDSIMSDGSEK